MEGSLRQYGGDPFSIGYHACSGRCTGNGSREKGLPEDKQEEKCVVQYPGNHLNR